ncbi:hypothetical protein [Marinigracilibium pacificum]|uniref:Uncharacterized protein n=1 Tax=Marinigracilibium pacificum TaxID=2729599 RepID=A0A848J250_9BACT|nr:hypothetical protein [Marinigracilibium pacificum]NMM50903.1 hypothetical protein [Marinigracilibium pacificum]
MNKENLVEVVKTISIRGRFAFGMVCIEQFIKENQLNNNLLNEIIDVLWEFTSSNELDIWEEKINYLIPEHVLSHHTKFISSFDKYLNNKDFKEIYKLYKSLDKTFLIMIKKVLEIGTGNLYGGTGKFSKWTLDPTIDIANLAEFRLVNIPNIEDFKFSSFSENNGWGKKFNREQLL